MGDSFANGRSILHKGDGNTHISAMPDVCKVPTPGGPVPTPFVNSAQDSMLAKGSTMTAIEGNPIALSNSELSLSSGDEPGTVGGLVSSKFKGKMAWSGASTDVKVEGKGVVRFLDPTLHNGNTFNANFIARGRTGLAYGDDAKCEVCKKPPKKHRVHETNEVQESVDLVFQELAKRLEQQRPLIQEYRLLSEKRNRVEKKSIRESRQASALLDVKKKQLDELRASLRRDQTAGLDTTGLREEIRQLQQEIDAEDQKRSQKRKKEQKTIKEFDEKRRAIKEQLRSMKPVLRYDETDKIFTRGYMVGVCICKCRASPKMLVACSCSTLDGEDDATGFKEAAEATPFKLVENFQMSPRQEQAIRASGRNAWTCAAPKLIQAGGAGGHKVKAMSERFYSPIQKTGSKVTYSHTERGVTRPKTQRIVHGESIPSCDACQKNVPEMLCDNYKKCR